MKIQQFNVALTTKKYNAIFQLAFFFKMYKVNLQCVFHTYHPLTCLSNCLKDIYVCLVFFKYLMNKLENLFRLAILEDSSFVEKEHFIGTA